MSQQKRRRKSSKTIPLLIFAFGALLLLAGVASRIWSPAPQPAPTSTSEPIIPTRTPQPAEAPATATQAVAVLPVSTIASPIPTGLPATATRDVVTRLAPASTPQPAPTAQPATAVAATGLTADDFGRIGISGGQGLAGRAWDADLRWTHSLDWQFTRRDSLPEAITYWRTLRIADDGWENFGEWAEVVAEAQRYPGEIWIIGNEPDVKWQDGVSAEIYAERYHEAYTAIKAADPTAQIAVGAVAAGSDLRLRYLDTVLATYQLNYGEPLPVDIWTVHAYVLREERDSWGVDIPPGMSEDSGDLYEIDDHDDLDLFTQQLVNFRQWMADNGYRDKSLAVTEFGILLPNDYGFPPETVEQYMRDTITIMLTLENAEIGQPQDSNRLVQSMFWFIFYYDLYPTGALWVPEEQTLSPLGVALRDFVGQ